MPSKSTRVSLSLPSDLLASLDGICAATGYSRAAVLHSLLVNTLPEMCFNVERAGWSPDDANCRYRGASAEKLDSLLAELLLSLSYREYRDQLLLNLRGGNDE